MRNDYATGFDEWRGRRWAALSSHLDTATDAHDAARAMSSASSDANYERGKRDASIAAAFDAYPAAIVRARIRDDYPHLAPYVAVTMRANASDDAPDGRG